MKSMKKFLLVACAMCSMGANAQHVEWSAASLPSAADGVAAGYQDYWGIGYRLPDNYVLFDGAGAKAVIERGTLATKGNSKYSGYDIYPVKILMGMNKSTRDGIDPDNFIEGLENNEYVMTRHYDNAGVTYDHTDAIVTLTIAEAAEGGDFGMVTLNYNRGGNNSAMYVVDQTKSKMVLQSVTRCPDEAIKTHVATFGVEPGHTYYILASEPNSVELYGIGYTPASAANYYDGTSTGIANVTANKVQGDNKMYNLAGQRITEPAKGQIYIMNGKKYMK